MADKRPSELDDKQLDDEVRETANEAARLEYRLIDLLVERIVRRVARDFPTATRIHLLPPNEDGVAMWVGSVELADGAVVNFRQTSLTPPGYATGDVVDRLIEDLHEDLSDFAIHNGTDDRVIVVATRELAER